MIDGMTGEGGTGKFFKNVEILANDFLYVFVEITADVADANPTDFLYTDQILFDAGTNQQTVDLVTLIKDAVFLFPDRTSNPAGGYTYEQLQLDKDRNELIKISSKAGLKIKNKGVSA
jgi:predicted neuraminidase